MNIEYKDTHEFSQEELERLFLSVEWSSGHFPDKLVIAMRNFNTVFSAWDGDVLVGMVCAMDDGIMNAYIHYMLVHPDYHGQTIGRTLVDMIKQKYKDYMRIAVIAYDEELHGKQKQIYHCSACGQDQTEPMISGIEDGINKALRENNINLLEHYKSILCRIALHYRSRCHFPDIRSHADIHYPEWLLLQYRLRDHSPFLPGQARVFL